jgi:hypothetical protein
MIEVSLYVLGAGFVGGFLNCLNSGGLHPPKIDERSGVWMPGWIGTTLIGAVTAYIIWGLYGSYSAASLFGPEAHQQINIKLHEFVTCILSGFGGGRVLLKEVDKRITKSQVQKLDKVKNNLVKILEKGSKK